MNPQQIAQLEKAKQLAISKGGECLSEDYVNSKTKLRWKCDNGHEWSSNFIVIVTQNHWCPKCKYSNPSPNSKTQNNRENYFKKMCEHAKSLGGECLSFEYINKRTKLIWKCSNKEHSSWEATPFSVTVGKTWCAKCAVDKHKDADNKINLAKKHAILKGGKCLSNKYTFSLDKLEWKCANKNHIPWFAKLKNVVYQDQWCPECANKKFKSENRVRLIFETYFNVKFPSVRPSWNINPITGKKLELDGFNEKLKIAFEHDGEHHFKQVIYSKKIDPNSLYKQFEKDKFKKENCKTFGINLINIPILKYNDRHKFFILLRHVINEAKKNNINMFFSLIQIREMKKKFHNIST